MDTKEICVPKGIFLLVFLILHSFGLLTNKRSVKISKDRNGRISYFYSVVVVVIVFFFFCMLSNLGRCCFCSHCRVTLEIQ